MIENDCSNLNFLLKMWPYAVSKSAESAKAYFTTSSVLTVEWGTPPYQITLFNFIF